VTWPKVCSKKIRILPTCVLGRLWDMLQASWLLAECTKRESAYMAYVEQPISQHCLLDISAIWTAIVAVEVSKLQLQREMCSGVDTVQRIRLFSDCPCSYSSPPLQTFSVNCRMETRSAEFCLGLHVCLNRLCGPMVRVSGYTTDLYSASCEVQTECLYVM
jgi:hypothetical protein